MATTDTENPEFTAFNVNDDSTNTNGLTNTNNYKTGQSELTAFNFDDGSTGTDDSIFTT